MMLSEDQYLEHQFVLLLDKKKEGEYKTLSKNNEERKEIVEKNKILTQISDFSKHRSSSRNNTLNPNNTTKNNLQKESLEKRKKDERIKQVVEEARIRLKHRKLVDMKEEKFNKNFIAVKNVETFIDARDVLQKINLMNEKLSNQSRKTLHQIIQQTNEEKSENIGSEKEEEEEEKEEEEEDEEEEDEEKEDEEKIDYNDEELEFKGIRKFRKAKFEMEKRILEKRSQIYESSKPNIDSLQSKMSKHLKNKAFKSEGAIFIDKYGTVKFEQNLLNYISQNERFPMPTPIAFSKNHGNDRNSLKENKDLELSFLEKLEHEKNDERQSKAKLEKISYYKKYKKQSDKILKLLKQKTKEIYDRKYKIKMNSNGSLSSIVNTSNLKTFSLPKIHNLALKKNKRSSDGMKSPVSFSVVNAFAFPTEINSPQSFVLNSPFSKNEKINLILKTPLKKKNKIIFNEKFSNLITDIDEVQKINSASKKDLISTIESAKKEINTSLKNIKENLIDMNKNIFDLPSKNSKNDAVIGSRMKKNIAAMDGRRIINQNFK